MSVQLGQHMRAETAQGPAVFAAAVSQDFTGPRAGAIFSQAGAIYTIARGSSDAVASVLAYEFMDQLGIPVTSLPPSVFSLGSGVRLSGAGVLVISQSGASDDLVRSAECAARLGASVAAITNVPNSAVGKHCDLVVPVAAGPEIAVPATKTVMGSIGAGIGLLAQLCPGYRPAAEQSAQAFQRLPAGARHPKADEIARAITRSGSIYVLGRGAGLGAAQEIALKLKETCALHAEALSASEVLHGPLQLVSKPLLVLILDTEMPAARASLDLAQTRFSRAGGAVIRLSPSEMGMKNLTPAAAAAALLFALYPVVLEVAVSLGLDPDTPDQLAKVTRTI